MLFIYTPYYYLLNSDCSLYFNGIKTNHQYFAYFYNKNKEFISPRLSTFSIPDQAVYVKFTYGFTVASEITVESYGGVDAVAADWSISYNDSMQRLPNYISALEDGRKYLEVSENAGFISGNGTIYNPTANNDVYTNFIEVPFDNTFYIELHLFTSNAFALYICTYDENDTFIERIAIDTTSVRDYSGTYTVSENVNSVRFTYRTFSGSTFLVSSNLEYLSDLEEDLQEQILVSKTVKTIAHRGDFIDAPQCVAPSYIIARKHGITIAENDLTMTDDGYFVMWHDINLVKLGWLTDINGYSLYTDGTVYYWVLNNVAYTFSNDSYSEVSISVSSLTRCSGVNYGVNSFYTATGLSFDILKRLDFGRYKGSRFSGVQIMTFEEWVLLCKQLGMAIYIDRKIDFTDQIAEDAATIVKKCGMADYASWLGMGIADVQRIRSIIPDARCCILKHPTEELISLYSSYNTGKGFFFNGNATQGMTKEAIQLGLENGFEVEVWYTDYGSASEEDIFSVIRQAVSYGVTGMSLDHYLVDQAYKDLFNSY